MDGKKLISAMLVSIMLVSGLGLVSGETETDKVYLDEIVESPTAQGENGDIIYSAPPPGYVPHTVQRTVLMEDNTNWGCGPCASHNPPWKATADSFGYTQVAPVFMHVQWPSSTDPWNLYSDMYTWANWRRSMQGCTYVPWPMIDGAWVDYGQTQAFYTGIVNNRLTVPSRISIKSSGLLDSPAANQGFLNLRIEATDDLPRADWRVIVQLWENNVTRLGTGPNGETKYDWATWLFLDLDSDPLNNHNGVSIWSNGAEAGSSVSLTYNFNLETSWPRSELGCTIFVQDFNKIGGGESSQVSIEQAKVELLRNSEPAVSITAPDPNLAGQILSGTVPITWTATDIQDPDNTLDISIDYSPNGGKTWTNIMSGTDNNVAPFTYNWNTASVPDGIGYVLRVTAVDSKGLDGLAVSHYPFSIDNVADDEWFFQVQTTGSFGDLDMKPAELGLNLASTGGIAAAGHTKIGAWQTTRTFTDSSINGNWTFKVYGKVPNIGVVPLQGYLYAKIFSSSNMATPLHTTALDNENVGGFQTSHLFTWASTASGNIASGDKVVVEIWMEATGGPYSQSSGATLNPGFDTGSTSWTYYDWVQTQPTGTYMSTGGNPGGYVEINLPNPGGNPNTAHTMAGYWQQPFTTGFAPYQASISFDYIYTAATSASTFYVFVDTVAGNPTIGTHVWSQRMTAVSTWATVGPIDISHIVGASTTYYVKIALYHGAAYPGSYPCTGGYDNVQVSWSTPYPWFEMEYDYAKTQSSVTPTIGSGGSPSTPYSVPLTGKAASAWVFVSYPSGLTGTVNTVLNDATAGDGLTTWTVAKSWDNVAKRWLTYRVGGTTNTLTNIDNTMGVWLWLTANGGDQVLTLSSYAANPTANTNIELKTGWNLVGYPSTTDRLASATLPGAADMISVWQATSPYITDSAPGSVTMSHGNAYWVRVTADATWVVAP